MSRHLCWPARRSPQDLLGGEDTRNQASHSACYGGQGGHTARRDRAHSIRSHAAEPTARSANPARWCNKVRSLRAAPQNRPCFPNRPWLKRRMPARSPKLARWPFLLCLSSGLVFGGGTTLSRHSRCPTSQRRQDQPVPIPIAYRQSFAPTSRLGSSYPPAAHVSTDQRCLRPSTALRHPRNRLRRYPRMGRLD